MTMSKTCCHLTNGSATITDSWGFEITRKSTCMSAGDTLS